MKSNKQHPTLNPSPLPKKNLESDVSPIWAFDVLVLPCLFALEVLSLCGTISLLLVSMLTILSVQFHFSNSSKCLHYEEEMHENWWALAGIKNPCFNEKKANEEDLKLLCTTLEGT
jgi:hypothetical protein